uniref:Uncharacterized protein n=1 Tax=Glossina morsitans morsitans TaxID=37546 RepID=A0A1B0F9Z8_GLOMM
MQRGVCTNEKVKSNLHIVPRFEVDVNRDNDMSDPTICQQQHTLDISISQI